MSPPDPQITALVNSIDEQRKSVDKLIQSLGSRSSSPPGDATPASFNFDTSTGVDQIVSDNSKLAKSFATMGAAIDRISQFGKSAIGGLQEFGDFGRNKYDIIQDQFGGIADVGKAATETSRKSVEAFDDIYATFYGNQKAMGDLSIVRNGKEINALTAFYDDASDISSNYMSIRDDLAMRQSLKFNEMSREDVQKLSIMEKGLQISNSKVSEILERQISTTGKASTKIFDEISAYSHSVSKATGVSFQEIAGQISNIITDVERFGNVQVDEAARIAGALNQLGLSYQGFGGMVDKFMNFDTAAESLGNLTTVFGVHFDAMEMMQLANEDQEEFLYRMREAFMDSGKAVEDMTLAEKKLASQQMGMSIQDFENFMQEDRIIGGLEEATQSADVDKGFDAMTDNMKLVKRDANDMKQFMINKVFDPVSQEAYNTGNSFAAMKTNLVLNPQKFLPGYQEFAIGARASIQSITATGGFKGAYTGQVELLQTELEHATYSVKNIEKLREQLAAVKSDGVVSMEEYMSVINSQYGSLEFATSATSKVTEQITGAITAVGSVLEESDVKSKIEEGILIDPKSIEPRIAEKFRELDSITQNALSNTGLEAQSPSKSIGIPILNGILGGFTELNSETSLNTIKGSFKVLDNNIKNFVSDDSNPVLNGLLSGKTSLDITSNSLLDQLNEISNATTLNSQNIHKASQEKTDSIVKLLDVFMKTFKTYIESPKVIENKLEIDGKSIATQLMKVKTDAGVSFSLVSPGGDAV